MKILIIAVAIFVGSISFAQETTAPKSKPKSKTMVTAYPSPSPTPILNRPAKYHEVAAPRKIEIENEELGSRETHRIGVLVGVAGEPIPSLLGFNVAYNFTDFARIQAGYGSISVDDSNLSVRITTLSAEAQFFLPNYNFSPVGLLGVGNLTGTITGTLDNQTAGLSAGQSYFFLGGGFDWQTYLGFTLELHYKFIPMVTSGLPGIALGWFF